MSLSSWILIIKMGLSVSLRHRRTRPAIFATEGGRIDSLNLIILTTSTDPGIVKSSSTWPFFWRYRFCGSCWIQIVKSFYSRFPLMFLPGVTPASVVEPTSNTGWLLKDSQCITLPVWCSPRRGSFYRKDLVLRCTTAFLHLPRVRTAFVDHSFTTVPPGVFFSSLRIVYFVCRSLCLP